MSDLPLTDRQRQVLDFIQRHHRQHGVAPSLREIQAHFGLASPFGVKRHVDALIGKGALHRLEGKARGLVPSGLPGRQTLAAVPLFGVIPAGLPVDAAQEPEGHVSIDPAALGVRSGATLFALRVRGDSMVDAGILDRDTVFLTPREPRPRDIVAALIDGETTLKRLIKQGSKVYLKAENQNYPDLIPTTSLTIQGIAKSVMKRI